MHTAKKTSPFLTVCVITKNEEQHLANCLESIHEFVDEIIVVDTGSSDNTIKIAESFHAKIKHIDWKNDFSDARNIGLRMARGTWILSIDADEVLAEKKYGILLRRALERAKENIGGFSVEMTSRTTRADGGKDVFASALVRIFRKNEHIQFQGAIHEQIVPSIQALGLEIAHLPVKFTHHGYDVPFEELVKKHHRNAEIIQQRLTENPHDAYLLLQRGKTFLVLGKKSEAAKDFALAVKQAVSVEVLVQAMNYSAVVAYQSADYSSAIEMASISLKLIPNQGFAHYIIAESATEKHAFEQALEHYQAMYNVLHTDATSGLFINDYRLSDEELAFRLGRTYFALKKYPEAEREFLNGINANPAAIACRVGLANILTKNQKYHEAIEHLQQTLQFAPERDDVRQFLQSIVSERNALTHQINNNLTNKTSTNIYSLRSIEPVSKDHRMITLSMIVKNEEEMLPDCLESVRGVVDEIIICDTGSQDRTIEIARAYGAFVVSIPWENNFAAARNQALRHSTGDWILYLDADERLSKESAEIIRDLVASAKHNIGAFVCSVYSFAEKGQFAGEHISHFSRLFRNIGYPLLHFEGRVHEQINQSLISQGLQICDSPILITHLGYNRSEDAMYGKLRRNYELALAQVQETPDNSSAWFLLAQTLMGMKLSHEAEQAYSFALDLGTLPNYVAAFTANTLAISAGNRKEYDEVVRLTDIALARVPDQAFAWHLRGYAFMELGKYTEARQSFQFALEQIPFQKTKSEQVMNEFYLTISEKVVREGLRALDERSVNHL